MSPKLLFFSYRRLLRTLFGALLLGLLPPADGQAAQGVPRPCYVVLLVPGIRAGDLVQPDLPSLARMISEGGSGWMVCRAARVDDRRLLRPDGRETDASLLATLGSGSRALALLSRSDTPLVRFAALQTANAHLDHSVALGALGELFHRSGLRTATLGDNDSAWPDSEAWYLAVDASGQSDFPMTHSGLLTDDTAPFGVRTDVTGLLADFDAVRPRAGLIVIACDALDRADRYALNCRPKVVEEHRAAARRILETLLSGVLNRCQTRNGATDVPILLLAPAPAASSDERIDRLAPIVWWGSGGNAGTLFSASTRRPGLVLNTDVLATFADRLHLPLPSGATGRPFHSDRMPSALFRPQPAAPSAFYLAAQYDEWLRVARLQNAPGGLPTLQLLLPLLGTALLFVSLRVKAETRVRLHRIVGAIATVVITLPLGMLVLPLLRPSAPWAAEACLTTLMLTVGIFSAVRPRSVLPLFRLLCVLLLIALMIDLLTGTHLLQVAWMSYSVVEGARFYGIGNEYMGVAIGAACVLFALSRTHAETSALPKIPVQGLGSVVIFVALTVAMGAYGAKVGAIPSAGAAFTVTLLVWRRGRLGLPEVGAVLLLAAAGLGLLALFDARHATGDQTHFIRALTGAGGGSLPEILRRKLQMEGWLLLHSAWSPTLVAAAATLAWIRRNSPEAFASRRSQAALMGLAAGAVACLLCNDSGLTAAALLLLYGWAWAALEATRTVPIVASADETTPLKPFPA
jgi:hypothetical protein